MRSTAADRCRTFAAHLFNHSRDKESSGRCPEIGKSSLRRSMQNWGGTVAAYSAVLYEFFADEIMAPRSAIYFRYNAPRPSPSPLSCRHSSIRQFHFLPRSFSSVSHRASALALASPVSRFSPLFSLFLIFFPHGYSFRAPVPAPRARGTARARAHARHGKGGCDLLAPFVRSTAYDFRRQDSGTDAREVVRTDWEPKWIFPGDTRRILYPK